MANQPPGITPLYGTHPNTSFANSIAGLGIAQVQEMPQDMMRFWTEYPQTGKVGTRVGAMAQLVARFHGMEEATGSNPVSSTRGKSLPDPAQVLLNHHEDVTFALIDLHLYTRLIVGTVY